MKRPRFALWIRWHGQGVVMYGQRPFKWCPRWLRQWAVRRSDRWDEYVRLNWKLAQAQLAVGTEFAEEEFK